MALEWLAWKLARRLLRCGIVDDVIEVLTAKHAITTVNGLNTHFQVGAGGFAGHTNPSYVYTVLDDFGTGYSSLNYLRTFPFQKIKIDRSFIRGLGEEHDAQAIIGAVSGLGASLDKIVVTEGIEMEDQMKQVKAHGCHEGQGYLFGKPMPAEIIRARLEASTIVAELVA